jgi:hypothetical protein
LNPVTGRSAGKDTSRFRMRKRIMLGWVRKMSTKHSCDPSERAFGRRAPGCRRCAELASGAPARFVVRSYTDGRSMKRFHVWDSLKLWDVFHSNSLKAADKRAFELNEREAK